MTPSQRKRLWFWGLLGLVACSLAILLPTGEYDRVSSPDGRHFAVARYPLWRVCFPMMPGSGSDKSGTIAIYTASGESCGNIPVEMVSFIRDLTWETNKVSLKLSGEVSLQEKQ
jgi:hypothetical protein